MNNAEALEIVERAIELEKTRVSRDTQLTDYARGAALSALSNLLVGLTAAFAVPVEPEPTPE